ncbi:MAG: DMT family transporter [Nocardioidaceae bacterium]
MRTFLLLVVGVVAVSLSGPLMAAMTVPPLALAFWRNALATVVLGPAVVRRRGALSQATGRTGALVLVAGVALAVHFAAWVTSLTLTSVASATALVSLQIAFVVAWQLLRGERFGPGVPLGLGIALAGVVVVSGVDLTVSARALLGDALALVGGAAAAAYMIVGARARRSLSTSAYTFGCYGSCAAVLLVACLVSGQPLSGYPAGQWGLLVLLTLTAQLLGHSVFNHLLAVVSPMVVSLALLLEVPGAALLAAVLLGQVPPLAAVLGLLLVIGGTALVVVANRGPGVDEAPVD